MLLARLLSYYERLNQNTRLPWIVVSGFIFFILMHFWQVVLLFKGESASSFPTSQTTAATALTVSALHLWGQYDQVSSVATTNLPLQLEGVVVAQIEKESRALIATTGHPVEVFKIGDHVPGGGVIKSIKRETVILEVQDHLESLSLPIPAGVGTLTTAH